MRFGAWLCPAALGCCALIAWKAHAQGQPAVAAMQRSELLQQAQGDLDRGDAAAAIDAFERALALRHAPDAETGLVLAYMQIGQYRRALAFCAHVAGEHLDDTAASALYAWLLRAGGQPVVARRVLSEALWRAPADRTLLATQDAFADALPSAPLALPGWPHRIAPSASPADLPAAASARVIATGVLLAAGDRALVPTSALPADVPGQRIWVRNGLGQTRAATVERGDARLPASSGATVLRLALALPGAAQTAERDPFAGSPGFLVQYAENGTSSAAWPWLRQGFIGAAEAQSGLRRLGIDSAQGGHGGAVLDAYGRVAGLLVRGNDGGAIFVPASAWRGLVSGGAAASASAVTGRSIAPDVAYEAALTSALQVIAGDR